MPTSFLHDIRYGVRALRRSPGFAAAVILTFALGVGVNTAVFSVVHTVLLKPLPYPDGERLTWFGESTGQAQGISVTWVNFREWRAGNHTFDDMAAYNFGGRTLTGRGEPLVTRALMVTAPYFGLLGMRPLLGRLFGPADDRPGAPAVVVLNHRFWSAALGGDPHVVGQTLTLDGAPAEVIGVAAPVWEPWTIDYYVPLGAVQRDAAGRQEHGSIHMLGRLKFGVTLAAARADLDGIMRHLADADPGPENDHRSWGQFLADRNTEDVRGTLLLLMGAAVLILLIACANVASLLLARNTARGSELAVRRAIGAGILRLVRQLLTESVVVAAAGGVAGVVFAYGSLRLLTGLAPRSLPRLADTGLSLPVLLFACAITLLAGLLSALAPVLAAGNIDLLTALKDTSRGSTAGRNRLLFRNALVVGEVALTFVLAFGSGLLLRSLSAAQGTSPGFDPRQMLSFSLQLPPGRYSGAEVAGVFYQRLLADLHAIPGVVDAGFTACAPGDGEAGDWFYSIPGKPVPAENELPVALFNSAAPGFFQMMRIPLREGREFDGSERHDGAKLAVVNEAFARNWWPREAAVGHQVKVGGPYREGDLVEIVGVVGNVRQFGLDTETEPEIYLPLAQQKATGMTILVRAAGDVRSLMPAVRKTVLALDRNLPVQRLRTVEEALGAGLSRRRFSTLLLSLCTGLAMLLAAVGIYGLLSYWVSSRETEIALRLALGAQPLAIVRWTSWQTLRLAAVGIAVGLPGIWAAARSLRQLIFGIPLYNPAVVAMSVIAVAVLAIAAGAIPARHAARVDAARRLHGA